MGTSHLSASDRSEQQVQGGDHIINHGISEPGEQARGAGFDASTNGTTGSSSATSSTDDDSLTSCTSWRVSSPLILIAVLGAGISAAFVATGVSGAYRDQRLQFEKHAGELVSSVASTWTDYRLGGLWVQEACRSTRKSHQEVIHHNNVSLPTMCSRDDFRDLFEYMKTGGLDFRNIAYAPNVTHEYRAAMEEEAASYYREQYPNFNYTGFMGFDPTPENPRAYGVMPRKPFYFPQHILEPLPGNENYVDYDAYSSAYKFLFDEALEAWAPVVSNPIPVPDGPPGFHELILYHPGPRLSPEQQLLGFSTGLSAVTITFQAFLQRAIQGRSWSEPVSVHVFDTTRVGRYQFFGGADVQINSTSLAGELVNFRADADIDEVRVLSGMKFEQDIPIEQQMWTVVVIAQEGTYEPELTLVLVGGCFILAVCACVAVWLYSAMRREAQIAQIKRAAESEKSALIVDSARRAAQLERQSAAAERHLNEYLSHEVRNPLTSAMAACSFLSASKESTTGSNAHQEDINVIHSSLAFINDLLRSCLDMHKVQNKQLELEISHTDVLKDILEPVRAILHRRDNPYEIRVECPENLVVLADRMRVKQVILNLAGNSNKFVQQGYICLGAEASQQGWLQLYVEDSGPGIPQSKQSMLFERFQSSLDSLNQGTGMGLSLCKSLTELMKGTIELDGSFESDVQGCPGARFVISLPECRPVNLESVDLDECARQPERYAGGEEGYQVVNTSEAPSSRAIAIGEKNALNTGDIETGGVENGNASSAELPEKLSVLVVDDELVLRKLLSRSIRRVAPGWQVQEASNGETALVMADTHNFDLIFMDQYMASVDKQLLGTETVHALRAKGIESLICGLSANDMEDAFLKSGANAFMQKPFSCNQQALKQDLLGLLDSPDYTTQ